MPRGKQLKSKKTPSLTLEKFVSDYDQQSLLGALNSLQDSMAWELLSSFLAKKQREFEVAALDLVRQNQYTHTAAHASGYAQALDDLIHRTIPEFKDLLLGRTGVIETPMPNDENDEIAN